MPASIAEPRRAEEYAKKGQKPHPPLRYQKRSLALLAVYLPFLIIPWVLTCVLAIRPLGHPSYYNQAGQYSSSLYHEMRFWMRFVGATNAIASLLTVPVTSALLAHGAVVYCQRTNLRRDLNLRQTLSLADRGWADVTILWRAFLIKADGSPNATGMSSVYLWMGATMILLSAIQTPLRQALVGTEDITIMTCDDLPKSTSCNEYNMRASAIAIDPEPYGLQVAPQGLAIPVVIKNLATVSFKDPQTYLWHGEGVETSAPPDTSLAGYSGNNLGEEAGRHRDYFISAVPNGTVTGVLREHAMRLNTSVECKGIPPDVYPTLCGGSLPLNASFDRAGQFSMEICVPGDQGTSPWTLSRNRQDITEDVFVKVRIPDTSRLMDQGLSSVKNFTVQCTGNTTRGYFELGNVRNNFRSGTLLETWPDKSTLQEDFNMNFGLGMAPVKNMHRRTPGPLMIAALALFGEESMFYVVANSSNITYPPITAQICQAGNIPFLRRGSIGSEDQFESILSICSDIHVTYFQNSNGLDAAVEKMLYEIASVFDPANGYGNFADRYLQTAMYLAIEAWLTQTAAAAPLQLLRSIYTSSGSPVGRPIKTLTATIVISMLQSAQLLGIVVLVWYIYSVPTWTTALDSQAVAQLTKDMEAIPPVGEQNEKSLRRLRHIDGLVGLIASDTPVKETDSTQEISKATAFCSTPHLRLARGGQGVISKALTQRRPSLQKALLEE